MEIAMETNKMVFRYYYSELPDETKSIIRNEFLEASGLSYTAFYHKLRNNSFSKLEKEKLNEICRELA